MNSFLHFLLVSLTSAAALVSALNSDSTITSAGCKTYPCMIFEDNFDFLDLDKWEHEITSGGGGNEEFQYYHNSRRNSFTRDGKLFIKPTLTEDEFGEEFVRHGTLDLWGSSPANLCTGNAWGGCYRPVRGNRVLNPIQSARLRSVKSFNFRYGRVEVEAKMPTGDWLWPAIWMLSKYDEYGVWPASGEIDIVEARGNRNLTAGGASVGIDQMGSTLHWGPKHPYNGWPKTHATKTLTGGKTFGTDFHKYQLEWGPDIGLVLSLDDEELMRVNPPEGFWKFGDFRDKQNRPLNDSMNPWTADARASRLAPFDRPFHFLMNVAVGGTVFFDDSLVNGGYAKTWENWEKDAVTKFYNTKHLWYPTWNPTTDDSAMQVNYVRVWKTKPDPTDH